MSVDTHETDATLEPDTPSGSHETEAHREPETPTEGRETETQQEPETPSEDDSDTAQTGSEGTTPALDYWEAVAATDVGQKRPHNEDAVLSRPDVGVFVVADGMGGLAAGEVASQAVVDAVHQCCDECKGLFQDAPARVRRLRDALGAANTEILKLAEDSQARMGSTVVAAVLPSDCPGTLHLLHAGDSRAYLCHGTRLRQLTRDHSAGEAMGIKNESAVPAMLQSVVTRAVGLHPDLRFEETAVRIRGDDTLLLCSDGLTRMLPDRRIGQLLGSAESLADKASRLIAEANAAGGADNISLVLVARRTLPGDPVAGRRFRWARNAIEAVVDLANRFERKYYGWGVGALVVLAALATVLLVFPLKEKESPPPETSPEEFLLAEGGKPRPAGTLPVFSLEDDAYVLLDKALESGAWMALQEFLTENGIRFADTDRASDRVLQAWLEVWRLAERGKIEDLRIPKGLGDSSGPLSGPLNANAYCAALYREQETVRAEVERAFRLETRNVQPLLAVVEDASGATNRVQNSQAWEGLERELAEIRRNLSLLEDWLMASGLYPLGAERAEGAAIRNALPANVDIAWACFRNVVRSSGDALDVSDPEWSNAVEAFADASVGALPYDPRTREWGGATADTVTRLIHTLSEREGTP